MIFCFCCCSLGWPLLFLQLHCIVSPCILASCCAAPSWQVVGGGLFLGGTSEGCRPRMYNPSRIAQGQKGIPAALLTQAQSLILSSSDTGGRSQQQQRHPCILSGGGGRQGQTASGGKKKHLRGNTKQLATCRSERTCRAAEGLSGCRQSSHYNSEGEACLLGS